MKCEENIILLDEYAGGELEESIRGAVSKHLDACAGCREELRLLGAETVFYRKIAALPEENFHGDWEAMRRRLVAESLIEGGNPNSSANANSARSFFPQFKNLFAANRLAFAALLLMLAGFTAFFLLRGGKTPAETEVVSVRENIAVPKTERVETTPEQNSLQTAEDKKPNAAENAPGAEPKPVKVSTAANKSGTDPKRTDKTVKTRIRRSKNVEEKTDSEVKKAVPFPPTEMANAGVRVGDEKKLANYLNKVHLFLLMFRNLDDRDAMNQVIGDKYQTEARMFLDDGAAYKQNLLREKNIPAVELLNEIEPLLYAISNLDGKNDREKIDDITAKVKQTGIVFKIRLWMSNTVAENRF